MGSTTSRTRNSSLSMYCNCTNTYTDHLTGALTSEDATPPCLFAGSGADAQESWGGRRVRGGVTEGSSEHVCSCKHVCRCVCGCVCMRVMGVSSVGHVGAQRALILQ